MPGEREEIVGSAEEVPFRRPKRKKKKIIPPKEVAVGERYIDVQSIRGIS